MSETPVDLDARRDRAAMKATELRRQRLYQFQADLEALHARQEALETMLAAPAGNWSEVAAKAQYLIKLFAETSEAQEPRRRELIAQTLEDLNRLCECAEGPL